MRSRLAFIFTATCISSLFLSLIDPHSFIDDLIEKVNAKREVALKESVFIHTDRNSYNQGDTLWLKGYINEFTFGTPTMVSQTVYVDLIDQNNKKLLTQEFYNEQGKIDGAIYLPNYLDDGEYNLVAYTSTMKNYSEQWYFNKPIYLKNLNTSSQIIPNLNIKITFDRKEYKSGEDVVAKISFIKKDSEEFNKTIIEYTVLSGNEIIKSFKGEAINAGDINIRFKVPENTDDISISAKIKNRDQSLFYSSIVPVKSNNVIVSFFPEGGEIMRSIKNKVAFLSTDSLRNGVDIAGHLVDEAGNMVTTVETEHNGLGAFVFVPVKNKTYSLSIDNHLYPLPKINTKGIALSIDDQTEDTLSIRVNSNLNIAKKIYITATMRDYIYWSIEGQVHETAMVKIPLKEIPKGILQITLFDDKKEPLAERLSFVNKHKSLRIEVIPNKSSFNSRDSVSLKIVVRDHLNKPVQSELSLSAKDVIFDYQTQDKHLNGIDNYFSLSSQLHGDWKQEINNLPTWNEDKTNRVIDLMLLTYGWRKFEWHKLSEVDSLINYELIKGRVTKGKKKDSGNISIHLISFATGQIFKTNTNSHGHFSFDKHNLTKSVTSLFLTPFSNEYSNLRMSILENENQKMPKFISTTSGQIRYQSDLSNFNQNFEILDFAQSQLLQEVVIKENSMTRMGDPNIQNFIGSRVASKSGEELTPSSDLVGLISQVSFIKRHDAINNKIFFRNSFSDNRSSIGALFIVDGIQQGNTYSNLSHISNNNIEFLTIIKGTTAATIYGRSATDGVVFITTKTTRDYKKLETAKNLGFINGYSKQRVFYSPQYKSETEKNYPIPDFRKTIYWNAEIITNELGEAVVNYYNADRHSTINISIQGMSNGGLYGSTSASYIVK